jgi:diadenosine tetraphosphatase ApaH/serine/threonine PP2A family protein phosphatase
MHLNRGNHETLAMTKSYGFARECVLKYSPNMYKAFLATFDTLPLCSVVDDTVFVVHGGIPEKRTTTAAAINKAERALLNGPMGDYNNLLWSDPVEGAQRGAAFSQSDTEVFLKSNGCTLLVRSHEVVPEGYLELHAGQCVTIFSASRYCGLTNKGAFMHFDFGGGGKPTYTQFYKASPMATELQFDA